ncbi:MAG: hypothetical protein LBJ96_01045, partial [Holosporaceae bacterium]|nr:hypothetical protein [Holosporaceae bacterium]
VTSFGHVNLLFAKLRLTSSHDLFQLFLCNSGYKNPLSHQGSVLHFMLEWASSAQGLEGHFKNAASLTRPMVFSKNF